ncbi:DUF1441 family protein [Photobacterium galatheae]|uniref:Fels-1 prophage-like protein n=1 Tax=Photobacterium galatheae TaxID=1654360 RepID=A0A066RYX0_9GAMM|nr:DUF1441 family protein [Photobacterium galatheae]KDM92887.1 Fels-1 prophage-like protein [Photobacterium galatheae]MCM0148148.1 DUF1441 family protein [Photobacterium galatheae]
MSEITQISGAFEWSISKIAESLGMSRNTVAKRLRENHVHPSRKEKGNFVYALKDAMPAIFAADSAKATGINDPDEMAPETRKAWFQSENERVKLERELGNLLDSSDVAREFSLMAKAVIQVLDTLPDVLERDCGLTPSQVSKVQGSIDDLRDQMALRAGAIEDEEDAA